MSEEIIKATPPIAISTITLLGVPLNEWVFILTIIYTLLQLFFTLRDKVWRPWKTKKEEQTQ